LSGFTLASQITLTTRSYQSADGFCFECSGDEQFELTASKRVEIGTTVLLRLKPEVSYLLDDHRLIQAIQKYAGFLPVPIYVNGQDHPLNRQPPPWIQDDPIAAANAFVTRETQQEPLAIIPLRESRVALNHDTLTVPLRGFLWVPQKMHLGETTSADLRVYIRRMLICKGETNLLPKNAFVSGVIECPMLQPTASREALVHDDAYEMVAQAIDCQLQEALRSIARHQPDKWKEIVSLHGNSLLAWAEDDWEFQILIEDLLLLNSSQGPQTLPDYLAASDGVIYFCTRQLGSLQERVMSESHGLPVLDASARAVKAFLERYAGRHPNTRLVQLDGDLAHLLQPASDPRFAEMLQYFSQLGQKVQLATFRPASIPALLVCTARAQLARETREALSHGDVPQSVTHSLQRFVVEAEQQGEALDGVLMLNTDCPLLQNMVQRDLNNRQYNATLQIVYQQAKFFSGRLLDTAQATAAFDFVNHALLEMLT
jgi:molecular chaperone HtpG